MFVSRLSVSEFILSPHLTVLGVVAGTVVYQPREDECPATSRPMKGMTRARTQVIQAVYDRLEKQAHRLGASGVIGIRTTHNALTEDLREHTVLGTAVGGCAPGPGGRPFTCTLSGQDYFALTAAGYRPVGVALGVCVYYQQYHQRVQQEISGSGQNVERSDFTRGLYTARHSALAALEAQAATLGADGVLGITVETKRTLNRQGRTSQGMMIEFTAIGTAVVASGGELPAINYAMTLAG